MAQSIKILPDTLHIEQQHRVGIVTKEWSYVEFTPGTYHRGQVVRDSKSSDLIESGLGTVTTASAIGENTLIIELLNRKKSGWRTALDTTTKYRLIMPGRVYPAAAPTSDRARGIIERDAFTVPTGEVRYGFVRQKGLTEGMVDVDGIALAALVTFSTGGLIVGTTAIAYAIGEGILGDLAGAADALMPINAKIDNSLASFRYPTGKEEPYSDVII